MCGITAAVSDSLCQSYQDVVQEKGLDFCSHAAVRFMKTLSERRPAATLKIGKEFQKGDGEGGMVGLMVVGGGNKGQMCISPPHACNPSGGPKGAARIPLFFEVSLCSCFSPEIAKKKALHSEILSTLGGSENIEPLFQFNKILFILCLFKH